MTIQSEISKELWNVNRKTKFDQNSEKLDALSIFEAMIYQPVERMRPLQIAEQLLSNILNNCRIGVCLRRRVRKMLQIISSSLQPVVKEVVIEVIVEVKEETEEVDEMAENVENVHIEIPAKISNSEPVEPVKILKTSNVPVKSVSNVRKSGRTAGTINYNDVIPAKVARIEKSENESRASAFINQMKNEGKSASAEKNGEEFEKVEVEIATGENGDEASVDDMLACLEW